MSVDVREATAFLARLDERQLILFLVRFAFHLTVWGRGTYVPGGDGLERPEVLRLINETVHRSLDHAIACLGGRTQRRPLDALAETLMGHEHIEMRSAVEFAFQNAAVAIGRDA